MIPSDGEISIIIEEGQLDRFVEMNIKINRYENLINGLNYVHTGSQRTIYSKYRNTFWYSSI